MKRASIIAVCFLLMFACGDNGPTTPATTVSPVTSAGVSLSPLVLNVPPGQTTRLTATARYSDGTTKDVTSQATWSSTAPSAATVSAGAVTGVALGRTIIRANFERWSSQMTIVIQPDGTYILKGKVTETGNVVVGGATVEVTSGPSNKVTTDSIGQYELFGVSGTVIVRFRKDGYFDENRSVTISGDQSLNVEITPRTLPAIVAGTYRMAIQAPASCVMLSADLKTRTYTAKIDQDAARLSITLSDASFVAMKNTFSGKVYGNTVTFDMGSGGYYYYFYYGAPPLQELLATGQVLGIFGTMTATATATQSISGTLVGGFMLKSGNRWSTCGASGSQVLLTRQ